MALSNGLCRLGHSLNGFFLAAERLSLSHIDFIPACHTADKTFEVLEEDACGYY